MRSIKRERRTNKWVLSIAGVFVIIVMLFPVYWMFQTSVTPTRMILSRNPPLLPRFSEFTLQAYADVWFRRPLLRWLLNSMTVSVGATVASVSVSAAAGYSLSRYRVLGQSFMGFFLLMSRMLPGTLLVIPLYIMFNTVGLLDTHLALVLATATIIVPFSTWMMKAFFDSIPYEIEESAMTDGCSPSEAMWRVVVPLSTPGLAAVTIYALILSWNEFLFASTFITSPDLYLFTVGIVSFVGEYLVSWNGLMAAGLIFILPLFVVFFLLEPFLVSGLTSGSVKY